MDFNLIKLSAIDSTNSYLKKLAKEIVVEDGTVVITENQTAGRGQMGQGWQSKIGESLTFSIFKQGNGLSAGCQFIISMAVSVGILEGLGTLNIPQISIKWPNDIMSANKKLGGILIENVLESHYIKYSVIGIGLNVNETDFPNLLQASSMKLATGNNFDLDKVLDTILKNIFKNLKNLSEMDFSEMKLHYENNLFRKERVSVFETSEGSQLNGIIKGVSDLGELLVETENNPLRKFQLKEVKLIY